MSMQPDNTREALKALLDRYTSLVNCGDCGNWDPETEAVVIKARAALAAPSLPAGDGLTPEWIWNWLMDYCQRRAVSPATHDSLFQMVKDARAILAAPRQPGEMGAGVQYAKHSNAPYLPIPAAINDAGGPHLSGQTASAQQDEREASEPPLGGRWHHGNGVVVCGTLRIFGEDFDTDPVQEFKEKLLTWVCDTLNSAQDAYRAAQQVQADAGAVALTEEERKSVAYLNDISQPPFMHSKHIAAANDLLQRLIAARPAAESDKRDSAGGAK